MPWQAERLPDGNLRVPMRAEADDGTYGTSLVTIAPDHPLYDVWDEWLTQSSTRR